MATACLFVLIIFLSLSSFADAATLPLGYNCKRTCSPWIDDMLFAGSWRVLEESEPSQLHPCCGWDNRNDSDVACGTERMKKGNRWPHTYTGDLEHWAEAGGNACRCKKPRVRYRWSPSSCKVVRWNATAFCSILNGREQGEAGRGTAANGIRKRLLLVGDSTMEQTASTLMNMIRTGGGDCHPQVVFGASDTLIGQHLGSGLNRGQHWLGHVQNVDPDFVVLGASAHIYSRERGKQQDLHHDPAYDLMLDRVINESNVDTWARAISQRYAPFVKDRRLHIMWKTSQPGGCLDHPVYPGDPDSDESNCFANDETRYNWNQFPWRDARTIARLNEHRHSHRVGVIDMRMLYWRKDAHVGSHDGGGDCLHYCLRDEVLSSTFPRMLLHNMQNRLG